MYTNKIKLLPYEIWRDIPDYEGYYQVSNLGNVKSVERCYLSGNGSLHKTGCILKPGKSHNGHLRVVLSKNGEQKYVFIHRLVAEAFIPNPDNLPFINHKDEDPSNNIWTNLEWCTSKYNANYGHRTQKIIKTHYIPVVQKTLDGKIVRIWENIIEAQEYIGKNRKSTCIGNCCRGRQKTAYGYKWEYYENNI